MKSKINLTFFATLLVICFVLLKIPATHAAQSDEDQIPSDLSLDLDLAVKNPAPDQKKIADVQTEKAQITTSKGEQVIIPVQEAIPQEIKTQSSKDAENPEQTTSEQVVSKNVEETVNPKDTESSREGANTNSNPGTSPSDNVIPGSNIVEPDDNTAPPIQTSPQGTPGSTTENSSGGQNTPQPTPAGSDVGNSTSNTINGQSNTIPPENGVAPSSAGGPVPDSAGSAPVPTSAEPAPIPPQEPQPASNPESAPPPPSISNDSTSGDTPAVQGVSIGPVVSFLKQFINKLLK